MDMIFSLFRKIIKLKFYCICCIIKEKYIKNNIKKGNLFFIVFWFKKFVTFSIF